MSIDSSASESLRRRRSSDPKVPRYQHIVQTLSDLISTGVYAAGDQLPSGSKLCADFGVSPMTVRRALTSLENQGLVYGVKGRGTFVKALDLNDPDFSLDSVDGEWLDDSADIRLLSASMTRADEKIADRLNIAQGQRIVELRRLVSKDGVPAMYHKEYILYHPGRALVESQVQLTALDGLLESDRGQRLLGGELIVSAVLLDADAAQALGQEVGGLALCLEHVFHDSDARPVSYGWFILRADLFRFRSRQGTSRRVIGVEILGEG